MMSSSDLGGGGGVAGVSSFSFAGVPASSVFLPVVFLSCPVFLVSACRDHNAATQ
jgi:hypothetical protein